MIVVLTYNKPHRKTQDLIFKLLSQGVKPLILATEWEDRKNFKPIITHRPSNPINISLSGFCENLGLELVITRETHLYNELRSIGGINHILLATGKLIQKEITLNFSVINAHPGYLPDIKGLDALKWAILYEKNIGVTTHLVNEEIDGGRIIERKLVPLYYEDTFHKFAYRQYEMEIAMLTDAIEVNPTKTEILESDFETFRRMPHRLEYRMLEKFEEMRKNTIYRTNHLKSIYV